MSQLFHRFPVTITGDIEVKIHHNRPFSNEGILASSAISSLCTYVNYVTSFKPGMHWPTWFLEIAFVHDVGILVCACVCVCVCMCVCVCACTCARMCLSRGY